MLDSGVKYLFSCMWESGIMVGGFVMDGRVFLTIESIVRGTSEKIEKR